MRARRVAAIVARETSSPSIRRVTVTISCQVSMRSPVRRYSSRWNVERLGVGDAVVAPTLEVRDQPTWDDRREDGFGIGPHLRVAAPGRAPQPGLGVPVPCRVLREKPTKVVRSLRRERFRRVLGRVAEDGLDRLPMFGIVLKQQAQVVGRAWDRAGRLQRTRL
jgi:hypothetical protein